MTKIVSVFNNKGGVGKTSIVWNLGHSLAKKGNNVLLIDFDAQCNLSIAVLGIDTFTNTLPTQNVPYGTTIRAYLQRFLQNTGGFEYYAHKGKNTNINADLLAGDFWLNVYAESLNVGADLLTGTGIAKYVVLREILDFANNREDVKPYDYALIDLPPSFGALVRAALYSSDYFLVPCTSDTFSAYCVSLIGQMLPIFFRDWTVGFQRFKEANPHLDKYDGLGNPKFAGWVFNGFDIRSKQYVKADKVHHDKIAEVIKDSLIRNDKIPSCSNLPERYLIGETEDMNVLIQNSIWQNVPVAELNNFRPIKSLQDRGSWSKNQRDQITTIGNSFDQMADNVMYYCT